MNHARYRYNFLLTEYFTLIVCPLTLEETMQAHPGKRPSEQYAIFHKAKKRRIDRLYQLSYKLPLYDQVATYMESKTPYCPAYLRERTNKQMLANAMVYVPSLDQLISHGWHGQRVR
jgi:hypothetical protein